MKGCLVLTKEKFSCKNSFSNSLDPMSQLLNYGSTVKLLTVMLLIESKDVKLEIVVINCQYFCLALSREAKLP